MDNETNDNQQNSDNKSEMFELEKQLHAQYATNASANTSSFFAFLVSILAVFYAFGYVYIFNTNEFAADGKLFTINDGHVVFTLDVLAYIASISTLLLTFLVCYCLELAWQQRRDHIIINNIRNRYFSTKDRYDVFKDLYSAKGKGWLKFIPNQYRYFILLFLIMVIVIFITVLLRLCAISSALCIFPGWLILGSFVVGVFTITITWIVKCLNYKSQSKESERIYKNMESTDSVTIIIEESNN